MTANSLIEATLEKIGHGYHSGTLAWIKRNRPNEWGNMLTFERCINGGALAGNVESLRGGLDEYQGLILAMIKEFKAIKENKEQGMFIFEETE